MRFQAKYLDDRPGGLPEKKTGMDDAGVVEDQRGIRREYPADIRKGAGGYFPVAEMEEFRLLPAFQGEPGDAPVGEVVGVIFYANVFSACSSSAVFILPFGDYVLLLLPQNERTKINKKDE